MTRSCVCWELLQTVLATDASLLCTTRHKTVDEGHRGLSLSATEDFPCTSSDRHFGETVSLVVPCSRCLSPVAYHRWRTSREERRGSPKWRRTSNERFKRSSTMIAIEKGHEHSSVVVMRSTKQVSSACFKRETPSRTRWVRLHFSYC